jgi:hypothetical protein
MGEWMVALRRVCLRMALVVGLASCAEGYASEPLGLAHGSTAMGGQSGPPGVPVAGSSGDDGSSADTSFSGETCRMGESAACTCESTGTEGTKTCRYDARSPTMGAFSECGNCIDPNAEPEPDPGDAMGNAGSGGRAGSGASAGSGTSSGSSGSGGASGSSSSGGSRGGCTPACNQSCFPAGVLACCRSNGTCGCTWAPGAYCL